VEEKRVRVVRIPERWEICEEGVGGYWCEHPCVCLVVQDETKHEAAKRLLRDIVEHGDGIF